MGLQVENGHTRIVNEVLEQLVKGGLLGSEYQVLLFVIRKTWGWNKKEDYISLSQFTTGTGLSRRTVIKTIKNLVYRKMLVKRSTLGNQRIAYKFNKYWKDWLVYPPALVQNKDRTSAEIKQKLVYPPIHTKDNTKENKRGLDFIKKMREQLKAKKSI